MSQYSFGKLPPGVLEQLPLRDEAWGLHLGSIVSLVYITLYLGETAVSVNLQSHTAPAINPSGTNRRLPQCYRPT